MADHPPARRVRALVRGRVQGVGFRAACFEHACRLGLGGSVANRRDGAVEVLAEGPSAAVETLLDWLRTGPPFARVDAVEVTDLPAADERRFSIRR